MRAHRRRGWLVTAAVAGWLAAAPGSAQTLGQAPVRIEVPYGPGGVADICARIVAQKMSEILGQQFIVENRPSAALAVASELVAKATPDGTTLLLLNQGHAVSVSLFKSLPYDAGRDFAPISTMGYFGLGFAVDAHAPYRTLADVLAAARAKPGSLNIGTSSIGSTQYISAELLKSLAAVDLQTVPFKTTPSIFTALRGGDVQGMVEILAPLIPQARGGAIRLLGVSFPHRFASLPDVPAIAETVPGYESSAWNGLAAPTRTPKPIIDRLNAAMRNAVADADVVRRLQDLGVDPRASSPEELHDLLVAETAKWKSVIEKAGIPKQ